MYSLKDDIEAMFLNSPDKIRAKKKLNELFDKYGESKRAIENGTDNVEYMEYVMASAFADEVLAERRRKRKEPNAQNDDWDEYNPYVLTDVEEEEEEEELSMTEQVKKVTEDKELQSRTGQMAVEAYKNLDKEKIRKDTEKYVKQTDKEQAELMNELREKFVDKALGDEFYAHLAYEESSDNYQMHLDDKNGIGALGKYQMRGLGLMDLGYLNRKYEWTGKDGIKSKNDFLNNEKVQEKVVREFVKLNFRYLKKLNLLGFIGDEISGKVADFDITLSGLLAAVHKEGPGGVKDYLKALEKNKEGKYSISYDKYEGNKKRSLLAVETRLRKFSK